MCVLVCGYVHISALRLEGGVRAIGARLKGAPCVYWEPSLGLLQSHYLLLTAKSSFQLLGIYIFSFLFESQLPRLMFSFQVLVVYKYGPILDA